MNSIELYRFLYIISYHFCIHYMGVTWIFRPPTDYLPQQQTIITTSKSSNVPRLCIQTTTFPCSYCILWVISVMGDSIDCFCTHRSRLSLYIDERMSSSQFGRNGVKTLKNSTGKAGFRMLIVETYTKQFAVTDFFLCTLCKRLNHFE